MYRAGTFTGKYPRDLRRTTVHDTSSQAWDLRKWTTWRQNSPLTRSLLAHFRGELPSKIYYWVLKSTKLLTSSSLWCSFSNWDFGNISSRVSWMICSIEAVNSLHGIKQCLLICAKLATTVHVCLSLCMISTRAQDPIPVAQTPSRRLDRNHHHVIYGKCM